MTVQSKPRIVVVDDETYDIEPLVFQLRGLGCQVELRGSATEAMDQSMEIFSNCDLAVVDVVMPPGIAFRDADVEGGMLTGIALVERLRTKFKTLRIMVLTIRDDKQVRDRLARQTGITIRTKPYFVIELAEDIVRLASHTSEEP